MKKLILLLAILLLGVSVKAQGQAGNDRYSIECNRIYQVYLDNPNDLVNLFAMADFYRNQQNPMRDLGLAIKYARQLEEQYVVSLTERKQYKELKTLIKRGITLDSVRMLKRTIENDAVSYVQHSPNMTQEEMAVLAAAFRGVPDVIRVVERRRQDASFSEIQETNSLWAFKQYVEKYKGSEKAQEALRSMSLMADSIFKLASTTQEVDEMMRGLEEYEGIARLAVKRKASIEYVSTVEEHTEEAYRAFLSKYPSADEYDDALEQLESLHRTQFVSLKGARQLADFAHENSDSPLAEQALEKLRYMVGEQRDQMASRIYFDEFPLDHDYANLYRRYYLWHSKEGNADPIEKFKEENPRFPYMSSIAEDLRRARSCDSINLMRPYSEAVFLDFAKDVRALTGKDISIVALQRTLQSHIAAKNWKACDERMNYFLLSFDEYEVCQDEYEQLRQLLQAPVNRQFVLQGEVTPGYNMRGAAVHPGNNLLFYTMQQGGKSTICYAQRAGGTWKHVAQVRFDNIENKDLVFFSFFENGKKMLLGQNGDILIAENRNSIWHVTEIPPYPVNTDYMDYDAYMVPDGSGILLASDRPYGHNYQHSGAYYHGDTALASDIYFIPRVLHGWGEAINLGLKVNTPFCDHSPVLSSDLKTLYFVSDGHLGLGYGDIFYCTRTDINDWTSWSDPKNYGKETNSGFDEGYLSLSADERTLYVCSNRNGRYGLYSVKSAHNPSDNYVNVRVMAGSETSVNVVDMGQQSVIRQIALPGDYEPVVVRLNRDKRYTIQPNASNVHFVTSAVFSPVPGKDVELPEFDHVDAPSTPQPLPAVQFEEGTSILTAVAQRELSNLANYLLANEKIDKVYISVNVPGDDDAHCYSLSRSRAIVIKRYLEHCGISSARILTSSFGNVNYQEGGNRPQGEVEFLW